MAAQTHAGRYEDGFRNGRLDYGLGLKLVVAWLDDSEYGRGYRDGWNAAAEAGKAAGWGAR